MLTNFPDMKTFALKQFTFWKTKAILVDFYNTDRCCCSGDVGWGQRPEGRPQPAQPQPPESLRRLFTFLFPFPVLRLRLLV